MCAECCIGQHRSYAMDADVGPRVLGNGLVSSLIVRSGEPSGRSTAPVTGARNQGSLLAVYMSAISHVTLRLALRLRPVLVPAVLAFIVAPAAALADTETSSIWAGYAAHKTGVKFRKVTGTWREPKARLRGSPAELLGVLGGARGPPRELEGCGADRHRNRLQIRRCRRFVRVVRDGSLAQRTDPDDGQAG